MRTSCGLRTALLLLASMACAEATTKTQVIIDIDADDELGAAARILELSVTPQAEMDGGLSRTRVSASSWPKKLVLAPLGEDADRQYTVQARALDGDDRVLAALSLRSGFRRAEARFVELRLTAGCREDRAIERSARELGRSRDAALVLVGCKHMPDLDAGVEADASDSARADASETGPDSGDGSMPADAALDANGGALACERDFVPIGDVCQAADPCKRAPLCEDVCEVNASNSRSCSCSEGGVIKPHAVNQCWHWQPRVRIDSSAAGVEVSNLAMNPSGVAVAVWLERQAENAAHVWANRYEPKVGWRGPVQLTHTLGDVQGFYSELHAPAVGVDNDGNALVLWKLRDVRELSAVLLPHEAWGEIRELATPGYSYGYTARIERDPKGGLYVASASGEGLNAASWWLRHFTRDGDWGQMIPLDEPSVIFQDMAFAVAESSHSLAFLWIDTAGSVWGSQLEHEPPYTPVTRRVEGTMRAVELPDMAVDRDGTALGVWLGVPVDELLVADLYSTDISGLATRWSDPRLMAERLDRYESPHVVFDGADRSTIAWVQPDELGSRVFAQGGGQEASIDRDDMGHSGDLDLAADARGNVIAAWRRKPGEAAPTIWVNRFHADAWSGPRALSESSAEDVHYPRVRADRNGDALAIWEEHRGGKIELWSRRLD